VDLVVIGDSKFEQFFDEILPKNNYSTAKIDGKQCVFFNEKSNFIDSLEVSKNIGAIRILEITNKELDSKRATLAQNMGFIYSGFSVIGKEEYIKPLIKVALNENSGPINHGLSEREVEVLELLGTGLTNKEIAKKLFLSEKTVKNHLNSIFKKIEVSDRTNAALYAVKNGII